MTSATSLAEAKDLLGVLSGPISTLRGLALRSFPELLVDIKDARSGQAGEGTGTATTTAISGITYTTLTYLETLPMYEKTVEELLGTSHSERSWLMGAKEPPSSVKSAAEEGGVVSLFVGECC
jgi:exocyst complex protein 7